MKRRIGILLAALTLLAGVPALAHPAAADTDVCAGHGTARSGAEIPLLGPDVNTYFVGVLVIGGCVSNLQSTYISASVTGTCLAFSGQGTVNGHSFTYTGAALTMVLQGEVTGTVKLYTDNLTTLCPQPFDPTFFRMAAAVVFTHPL